MHSNSWFIVAHDWMCCCLRLVVQLVEAICLQLVVQSLVSNACDWTSHDWVDQTMSYQLIQTTSFAMHPRLVECNAEALVWMYKLPAASVPAGPFAPADLTSSAEHDVVTNDIIIDGPLRCSSWFPFDVPAGSSSSSSACSWFISFQLIHCAPAGSTWPPPDFEHLT
ncbi:hypothetical protein F511_17761 [Dorcoceras hygrometricum]|uniref:Secreted protein n=1 Tax=Dorcoceras hygrometricum TaxID=472368 RepID=A0A2Z7BH41_9LAMI|nr:hypothetical protein F511_17761 [Dorcoceras hygrometricum]